MRDERGQTATEYLGIVLLVAAIVAAVLNTGVGSAIAGGLRTEVCRIAQQDGCGPAGHPRVPPGVQTYRPGDGGGGYPSSGPAIGGAPADFPVLPFPGSVSVQCKLSVDPDAKPCQGGGVSGERGGRGASADAGVRATGTVLKSDDRLNAQGCPTTTLTVSASLEAYGNAKVDGKVAGAGAEVYKGQASDYSVTTTPAQAKAYGDGAPMPNPQDPTTLQPGEGIELSQRYYQGHGLDASYRDLQVSSGFETGRKLSSGVKRISPSTVRVYVGDSDYVKQALSVGVGLGSGNKVYFGGESRLTAGKLRSVDIDVSTPAGWAAYQAFATTGKVPAAGATGTTNPTTADTSDLTSKSKLGVKVNGIEIAADLGDGEAHRTDTHNPDGSTTTTANVRQNEVGIDVTRTVGPDGQDVGQTQYGLNLQHVDKGLAQGYAQGGLVPIGGAADDGTVRLSFTAADLNLLRDQAADHIRHDVGGDPPLSRDEIRRQLAEHPGVIKTRGGGEFGVTDTLALSLAEAKTPEDALIALSQAGFSSGTDTLTALAKFAGYTRFVHGTSGIGDDLPGKQRIPGTQVMPNCPA